MNLDLMFSTMPKIDLHRHLEGSLRLTTLNEIASNHFPELLPSLKKDTQIQKPDPANPQVFLSKFRTLRKFFLSLDLINRFVFECVEDCARDGLAYLELRFSPSALTQSRPELISEVIQTVATSAQEASRLYNLPLRLIVSINRHEPLDLAAQILDHTLPFAGDCIAGIDIAGDEAQYSALPFQGLLQKAKQIGLALTVHAGEWGSAQNVVEAIQILKADRIGHGVRLFDSKIATNMATISQIPFEVCITSNIDSGIFENIEDHPVMQMIQSGIFVTINSDDPQVSGITLSGELALLSQQFGLDMNHLLQLQLAAIDASFLPAVEKEKITTTFLHKYHTWLESITNLNQ